MSHGEEARSGFLPVLPSWTSQVPYAFLAVLWRVEGLHSLRRPAVGRRRQTVVRAAAICTACRRPHRNRCFTRHVRPAAVQCLELVSPGMNIACLQLLARLARM